MKNVLKFLLPVVILMSACKKDDVQPGQPQITPAKGIYILSEGSFGGNNSKLAYRDLNTAAVTPDFYRQQNNKDLGDTGNDAIIYGGKMYIVMNGSGYVAVSNASTAMLIDSISFKNGSVNKGPRFALGVNGKVFVTSSDGTVSVIDTTTLSITRSITVGSNPEGIVSTGNYIYVANSGGFSYPDVDSTVSVVDLNTLTEIKKITVGKNPNQLAVSSIDDVYVTAYGVGAAIPPSITVINSATNLVKTTLPSSFKYSHIKVFKNIAYLYNQYGSPEILLLNTDDNSVVRNNFVADGTSLQAVYNVSIDVENEDVYVTDAKDYFSNGEVFCFSKSGAKKYSFVLNPGVNPNKILFIR